MRDDKKESDGSLRSSQILEKKMPRRVAKKVWVTTKLVKKNNNHTSAKKQRAKCQKKIKNRPSKNEEKNADIGTQSANDEVKSKKKRQRSKVRKGVKVIKTQN